MAGLDPKEFAAHGLRSGYLTEAARQGVALPEAMQQSQYRSVQQAASYYNEAERAQGRAARRGSGCKKWSLPNTRQRLAAQVDRCQLRPCARKVDTGQLAGVPSDAADYPPTTSGHRARQDSCLSH
jgi:hypothetical protein